MADLKLVNLTKVFENETVAVAETNLNIEDGEFLVLVGPSGCGKSTTLRMIAGLEFPTGGDIFISNKNVTDLEPKERNIAMVFQNYALYPHKNVFDNLGFGLHLRKVPKGEITKAVEEAAELLSISKLLYRFPKQLSGGQRQRVAVGRAIVRHPEVFLMDEPLSNLDAKLRIQMRTELIKLHKKLKTTTIYVTHDQIEAMTMGTRIVVMKDGIIQQVGTPKEIYMRPKNLFVAGFIGAPPINFMKGILQKEKEKLLFKNESVQLELPKNELDLSKHNEVILGIRPECLVIDNSETDKSVINCEVEVTEYLGAEIIIHSKLINNDERITAKINGYEKTPEIGEILKFKPSLGSMHLFDFNNGHCLASLDSISD